MKVRGKEIQFGNTDIDLALVEQLVSESQVRTIGAIMDYLKVNKPLRDSWEEVYALIEKEGLEVVCSPYGQAQGESALLRIQEVLMAINRCRTVKVR